MHQGPSIEFPGLGGILAFWAYHRFPFFFSSSSLVLPLPPSWSLAPPSGYREREAFGPPQMSCGDRRS